MYPEMPIQAVEYLRLSRNQYFREKAIYGFQVYMISHLEYVLHNEIGKDSHVLGSNKTTNNETTNSFCASNHIQHAVNPLQLA